VWSASGVEWRNLLGRVRVQKAFMASVPKKPQHYKKQSTLLFLNLKLFLIAKEIIDYVHLKQNIIIYY
jgi:hypothetical protein